MKHVSSVKNRPKVAYASIELAFAEAAQQTKEKGVTYESYFCKTCANYHIGRSRKRSDRRQKIYDEHELGRRVAAHLAGQNNGNEIRRREFIAKMCRRQLEPERPKRR
jgi:hypothetical protein